MDGGLRRLLRQHLPEFHWTTVETAGTEAGVPDVEYCRDGQTGWVELKSAYGATVRVRPFQVAWIERRLRAGGRVTFLIRRQLLRPVTDQLWYVPGRYARDLATGAARLLPWGSPERPESAIMWDGGPASWPWSVVGSILIHCKD